MSTFIESTACRGRRPQGLVSRIHHPRSELVARLLKERHVARFLVAPDGFGKTSLAWSYAEVVFSFSHVFWVNARSPCFLRDLDAQLIGEGVRRLDESASLVVFEDLPRLDAERARLLARLLDELLEQGVEVLATCAPSCDVYGGLQQDRLLLTGYDLLLNPADLRISLRGERLDAQDAQLWPPAERIACLRWKEDGEADLVAGIRREELPCELMLAMLVLLLMRRGEVGDLRVFLGVGEERAEEVFGLLERGYPFLGIVLHDGSFATADLTVSSLASAAGPLFDMLARASAFGERDVLAARLADALLARGEHGRAMELVLAFSTKVGGGAWLVCRGWRYVADGEVLPVREAYDVVARSALKNRCSCNVLLAWTSHVLGDVAGSVVFAKRAAFNQAPCRADAVLSCALIMRSGSKEQISRAGDLLRSVLPREDGRDGAVDDPRAQDWVNIEVLGRLALAFGEGASSSVQAWREAYEAATDCSPEVAQPSANALLIGASWLFEALSSGTARVLASWEVLSAQADLAGAVALSDVELISRFTVCRLNRAAEEGLRIGWCELSAFSAMERAVRLTPSLSSHTPEAAALARLRRAEVSLLAQQEEYRKSCALRDRQTSAFYEAHPNAFRNDARTAPSTSSSARVMAPMLHVNLFGSLEVRLGEEAVDPELLKQRKVKTLLAVLVLARGREVTRDKLARMLWPQSSLPAARKNLYATWAKLVRVLSVEGSCPYLVRDQRGCRINARLVTSDVAEFESICRTLLFGKSDEMEWESLYASVEGSFADELMPTELDNEAIVALRDKYHIQLIDALLAAANRLVRAGEAQGALWFAREALRRDRTREDAYSTLMEAQLAAGQRASALDTFFACKRYLSDELGIDPSVRIVELYRSIIEVEENLA